MKRISIIIVTLALFGCQLHAQEVLIDLQENAVIKQYIKTNPEFLFKSTQAQDTLELPFFDDFSVNRIFPADSLWEDNDVFINQSYADYPPTIGVATFDVLGSDGSMHSNASSVGFIADALTSRPINLENITIADSLYLSFFYQPQGLADFPEQYDSLFVEFYSPEANDWFWAWGKKGTTNHPFTQVVIAVPDTAVDGSSFYQKGFKFRFSNRASMTGQFEASWASNCDQWHLDYIYMNTGRNPNDTVLTDLAFLSRPNYLLKDYTAMPWRHFAINSVQMEDELNFLFYNYHNEQIAVTKDIVVTNNNTGAETIILQGAGNNYNTGEIDLMEDMDNYFFTAAPGVKSVSFDVTTVVNPGPATTDFIASNDTASYTQVFNDYYAYDDGTAESGYGLAGPGTQNALVALKFQNYFILDSIRGVDIFFNRTLGDANQNYFYVMVWDHDETTNGPGEIIFSQIGLRPEFEDSLNKFHRYHFQTEDEVDTAFVTSDIFYIGWRQTTEDLLNVGFDKNTILNETNNPTLPNPLYYNISGGWQNSSLSGALMLRPVFSDEALLEVKEPKQTHLEFKLYPNPCSNILQMDFSGLNSTTIDYHVYDLTGRIMKSGIAHSSKETLDTGSFSNGIYFIKVTDGVGNASSVKFVVQH